MARNSGDEDVRTSRRNPRGTKSDSDSAGAGKRGSIAVAPAASSHDEVSHTTALRDLFLRTDGWLRAIPCGEQKRVYLKWKFTRGDFSGKYVMDVITPWEALEGIERLHDKIARSYDGDYKPTPDRWYLPIFDEDTQPK